MAKKTWGTNPNSGGIPIPPIVQQDVRARIEAYAHQHYSGKFTRLEIYFKKQFCYIDAYKKVSVNEIHLYGDLSESREEKLDRLRNTPTHLCRLRYHGRSGWSFGFYTYSHERYELCVFSDGQFFGTPEDAFECSASVYIN